MNDFSILSPHLIIVAQEAAPPIAGPGGGDGAPLSEGTADPGLVDGQQAPVSPFGNIIYLFILLFVFMIGMQIFAGRKEKKRRAEMLGGISRHDRVQTVGGMLGTVADVRGDEIIVKIDESTNTKVRIVRSAIQQVLKKSGEGPDLESAETEKLAS